MKLLIASDIHGSAKYCRQLLEAFTREGADKLVLLGDILYHGPRNPLPEEYAPQEVAGMLTEIKDKIICVRGNCDAEIDECLLPFPLCDYSLIYTDGLNICLSHGHRDVPPLGKGDVYLTGHTHLGCNVKHPEGYYQLNPGSVSLPKEDSTRGYILYSGRVFTFKSLEGEQYDKLDLRLAAAAPVRRAPARPPVLHRKVIRRR